MYGDLCSDLIDLDDPFWQNSYTPPVSCPSFVRLEVTATISGTKFRICNDVVAASRTREQLRGRRRERPCWTRFFWRVWVLSTARLPISGNLHYNHSYLGPVRFSMCCHLVLEAPSQINIPLTLEVRAAYVKACLLSLKTFEPMQMLRESLEEPSRNNLPPQLRSQRFVFLLQSHDASPMALHMFTPLSPDFLG